MSKMKIDVEFPCGYKLKVDMEGGWFTVPAVEGIDKCPLHGKECPPKK